MAKKSQGNLPDAAIELRRRAEEIIRGKAARSPEDLKDLPPEETRLVLHELRVHQIELEMQNEELRRAQEELIASQKRYFDLYNLAPVGYFTVSEQGLILEANLTLCALLGLARDSLVKQPFSHFIFKDDQDICYLCRKRLLETGKPQACELRIVKPDGTLFWGHLDATTSARVSHIVMSDITEKKKVEEALIKLTNAKAEFTSMVSHELRSPLASIKAATELVWDGTVGPVNDQQKDTLGVAKSNIARLGRLINNVLVYQKMEAEKMRYDLLENDLNEVIREVHKSVELFAGNRKADLVMDLGNDLPKLQFDRDKIFQVLINLMANAINYSEGGTIIIQTRLENSGVHISVRDSGAGIKADYFEKIFEPFSQLENCRMGGTGLGLAISKKIVLAHDGKIWVESEIGKGSTFHFTLPL